MTTLRLFISEAALPLAPDTLVAWTTLSGLQTSHGKSALAQLPDASRIELFLPPVRVLRTCVNLPRGAGRQASKLLPFALDQILLAEPTEQHLAHRMVDETCHVAAIERDTFAEILNTLTQLGRRPRAAWAADTLIDNQGTSLLWCGNGWARRTGETSQWFDAPTPLTPPALLVSALAGIESEVVLAIDPALASQIDLDRWHAALAREVLIPATHPHANAVSDDAIDLMQGEFAAGAQIDIDWVKLRPAGILAAAIFSVFALVWFGEWLSWHNEERALKDEMNRAFVQAFPGTPVYNAQLQLQANLRTSASKPQANSGALAPLLQIAPQLAGNHGQLLSVEYADGHLRAEYQAKPEQLTALLQALSQNGKVETSQSSPDRTLITLIPRS